MNFSLKVANLIHLYVVCGHAKKEQSQEVVGLDCLHVQFYFDRFMTRVKLPLFGLKNRINWNIRLCVNVL